MIRHLVTFLSGGIFAAGLAISQMTTPSKIINFLDITGNWDPSLLLVMVGAIGVHASIYRISHNLRRPLLFQCFDAPAFHKIDTRLIIGSAIFGIGWGTVGFCPGPAIQSLITGHPQVVVFTVSMLIGMFLTSYLVTMYNKKNSVLISSNQNQLQSPS